jgi:hypothetical protein
MRSHDKSIISSIRSIAPCAAGIGLRRRLFGFALLHQSRCIVWPCRTCFLRHTRRIVRSDRKMPPLFASQMEAGNDLTPHPQSIPGYTHLYRLASGLECETDRKACLGALDFTLGAIPLIQQREDTSMSRRLQQRPRAQRQRARLLLPLQSAWCWSL